MLFFNNSNNSDSDDTLDRLEQELASQDEITQRSILASLDSFICWVKAVLAGLGERVEEHLDSAVRRFWNRLFPNDNAPF